MLHEGYTEESSDKMLKVGEVGEELPDGVYAFERVVSSRQRGSVSSVTLHDTGWCTQEEEGGVPEEDEYGDLLACRNCAALLRLTPRLH